jgi:hypothetical protein
MAPQEGEADHPHNEKKGPVMRARARIRALSASARRSGGRGLGLPSGRQHSTEMPRPGAFFFEPAPPPQAESVGQPIRFCSEWPQLESYSSWKVTHRYTGSPASQAGRPASAKPRPPAVLQR